MVQQIGIPSGANRLPTLRERLNRIIFESDTRAGRAFDVALILSILASVVVIMLDSVAALAAEHGDVFVAAEWFFTILFTVEYVLRVYASRTRVHYARSFFGIVDLLAILPSYLSLFFPAGRFLLTVRILRVVRIFRVLKLATYVGEAGVLMRALKSSRYKITVFLLVVLSIVVIVGSLMYLIEGGENGFTSIPRSIYWAVVTLTTVGYGDIAPRTTLGQTLAMLLMVTGYGIIAVPTGIVTVELNKAAGPHRECASCHNTSHDRDANFCKFCGEALR